MKDIFWTDLLKLFFELKSKEKECQTTRPADNSDRDKSACKRGQVGPYVKTTRTVC